MQEGAGDRTELQHIDPHSYGHQHCLSCSPGLLNRRPWGPLCWLQAFSTASCHQQVSKLSGVPKALLQGGGFLYHILSLTHLISNSQSGVLRAPFCWVVAFPTTSCIQLLWTPTNWLPVFTELYDSSIAHSISLEWHVWLSSSGNNCHAVHRSLSFGASVYACTMGFYLVPYCQPSPPMRFLLITAIGMCHFLPVHHFGMACLTGSKVNIQQIP